MVVSRNDGLDNFKRPDSTQPLDAEFSPIQPGVVTKLVAGSNAAFVKLPLLNENAEVGPFSCLQPFTNEVTTPVKQTLNVTTGMSGFVTSVSLSNTTTDISGVYGTLMMPEIGDRVLVVLMNGSLDDGVILGKI